MTPLSQQQKELIFEYCMGITSQEEAAQAQELIFSNEQAAELAGKFQASLAPLEILPQEQCPDELADLTVSRLKAAAQSSRLSLQHLLAQEQVKGEDAKVVFRRNLGRVILAAAAVYLVAFLYLPSLKQARYQAACLAQLQSIGKGIVNYQNEYNGQLPTVAAADGSPWWKVGYKNDTNENCSNTRHMWILVRGGYVEPKSFICPGSKIAKGAQYNTIDVNRCYDFPSREAITYSFRLRCNKSAVPASGSRKVLASDLNPLFEQLPKGFDRLKLQLDTELQRLNSINHNRRGQNVLFCDGSVTFIKSRFAGKDNDDIFTLRDIVLYQGTEIPASEDDAFVAP